MVGGNSLHSLWDFVGSADRSFHEAIHCFPNYHKINAKQTAQRLSDGLAVILRHE